MTTPPIVGALKENGLWQRAGAYLAYFDMSHCLSLATKNAAADLCDDSSLPYKIVSCTEHNGIAPLVEFDGTNIRLYGAGKCFYWGNSALQKIIGPDEVVWWEQET